MYFIYRRRVTCNVTWLFNRLPKITVTRIQLHYGHSRLPIPDE